jgi:hypothetical protein
MKVESVGRAEGPARVGGRPKRKSRKDGTNEKADSVDDGRSGTKIGKSSKTGVDITG